MCVIFSSLHLHAIANPSPTVCGVNNALCIFWTQSRHWPRYDRSNYPSSHSLDVLGDKIITDSAYEHIELQGQYDPHLVQSRLPVIYIAPRRK